MAEIDLIMGRLRNLILLYFPVVLLSFWSFRQVKNLGFIKKVLEKCGKLNSQIWVSSKDSRRLKIVDLQVFNFAYNYLCFLNNLVFLEGPARQEFDPHGDFKGKVVECNSTSCMLHFECRRRREMAEFQGAKKPLFSL